MKKSTDRGIRSMDLDQTNIPDPVSIELCKVWHRLSTIEKELNMAKLQGSPYSPGLEPDGEDEKPPKFCTDDILAKTQKK